MEETIKKILEEVLTDKTKVIELSKYNLDKIVQVAIDNKMFDSLLLINSPITINGEKIIYLDIFSSSSFEHEFRRYESEPETSVFTQEFIDKIFNVNIDDISDIKIKNSHARQISGHDNPIKSIYDVVFYSEPACLAACIEFYKKGIRTTNNDTVGVIEDGYIENGVCKLFIADFLSLENKLLVDSLLKKGIVEENRRDYIISVPCSSEDTVGEVSARLLSIVSLFKEQNNDEIIHSGIVPEDFVSGLRKYQFTNRDLYNKYFSSGEVTWDDVFAFVRELGFYYDEEYDRIWITKKDFDNYINYLKEKEKIDDPQNL